MTKKKQPNNLKFKIRTDIPVMIQVPDHINTPDDGGYHLQSGNVGTEINSTRNQGSELKGDKYYFDIGWEINKYCTEQGISPLELIEFHKAVKKREEIYKQTFKD
jgi:hypothetical protein